MNSGKDQQGVDQGIRFDQGSIQIDAEWLHLFYLRFGLRQDFGQM